jgi:tetratricopeptide (TPR) repeat protein
MAWMVTPVLSLLLFTPVFVEPSITPFSPNERIRFLSEKIAADPGLYPAYAQLAEAYLDKTRETHDPSLLRFARRALDRSLAIQPNLDAMKAKVAVANYSHRFDEALNWGRRVLEASPRDTAVVSQMVEAHLARGRIEHAEWLLGLFENVPEDFFLAAAQGHILVARHRTADAARAFQRAAKYAADQDVKPLVVWAMVRTAGVWLDEGSVDEAGPYLDAAARIDPENVELRIHQAELAEGQSDWAGALKIYETLLQRVPDPALHARAVRLARELGDTPRADHHFRSAEAGFLHAVKAGEAYTLGALASLYDEWSVHLPRALHLARRNLKYLRNEASWKIFNSLKDKCRP